MNPKRPTHGMLVLVVGALAVSSAACSQKGLREQYRKMRPAMLRGEWNVAVSQLDKAKDKVYGEKDRVMYWLNMGTLLHYARQPDKSEGNFVKAEETMQDLWTTSISAEASKVLLNETAQSYAGEDFEKVLIYLYTSLNKAQTGNLQDALVEARRADEFLKKLKVHSEKEGEVGTIYTQDAFMLWLVGLYYEMEGMSSMNDAFLAYKAAYKAYKDDYAGFYGMSMPSYLGEDLIRTAKLVGFNDEAATFAGETGATGETLGKLAEMGELIVIHGNGESPFKRELIFDGKMPDGYVMRVAVPEFVAIPPNVAYAQIEAAGTSAQTVLAEPLTQIVLENFKHRVGAIKARAIARAVIKYAATKGASAVAEGAGGKGWGALVGLAGNIAAAVSEAADLRSWTLLPAQVGVARVWLPPGDHTVAVTYHTSNGKKLGATDTFNVTIAPGTRQIVSVRSIL